MADFNVAYNITMGHEGGYANHPSDTGGETWKGISRNNWPKWAGWPLVDRTKNEKPAKSLHALNLSLSGNPELNRYVLNFYKRHFWDVYSLDMVKSQAIANEMFDSAVNMGIEVESKFLQRALNLSNRNSNLYADLLVDGDIGPKTISVLNAHPRPQLVVKILNVLQGARYISICENRSSQEVFVETWFSRVAL